MKMLNEVQFKTLKWCTPGQKLLTSDTLIAPEVIVNTQEMGLGIVVVILCATALRKANTVIRFIG